MLYYQNEKAAVSAWVVTAAVVVVSVAVCVMAWQKTGQYSAALKACREDTRAMVAVETKKAAADIEEKYSADRISYEVMSRRVAEMDARKNTTESNTQ
jgi:hypothetical protein